MKTRVFPFLLMLVALPAAAMHHPGNVVVEFDDDVLEAKVVNGDLCFRSTPGVTARRYRFLAA